MGPAGEAPPRFAGLQRIVASLRFRLGAITVLALVPALIVLLFNAQVLRNAREQEVKGLALRDAQSVAAELRGMFEGTEATLRVLALQLPTSLDRAACTERLAAAVSRLSQFASLVLANGAGNVMCRSTANEFERSVAERDYVAGAIKADGRLYVGNFIHGRASGRKILPLSLKISGPNEPVRILVGAIDTDWLAQRLRDRELAKGSALTISDRDGMILFREPFPERFIGTRIPDDFIRLVRAKEPGSELVLSQDGTDRYIGYVPSGSGPPDLYISAGVSTKSAFAFLNEALRLNLLLITVAALGSVAAATYVGHRLIHRPLVAIRSVARSWLAGDYTRRTGMHSNAGEIGAVGAALDKMVEELGLRETDRRLAEEQRLILVRELQHRVKNTLAVVQAIAGQSLRGTPETAVQMEAFRARLAALSQTYDILTDQNWRGASLQTVVRDSLATQFPEGRFRLSGPDPHIKPNAALALSLALHELATNALKYGALSTPTGSVDVNWSMEDGATPSFLMTWTESGGPPATTPEREGFGSRLLGRILAQQLSGTTAVEWLPTGLRFTVRCPLDQLRDQG